MHLPTTAPLLLALSAGALALWKSPPLKTLPDPVDPASISTYADAGCKTVPLNPTLQIPSLDPDNSTCLLFGANPKAYVGVHWGNMPDMFGVIYYADKDCATSFDRSIIHRKRGQADGCYVFEDATFPKSPVVAVQYLTWGSWETYRQ